MQRLLIASFLFLLISFTCASQTCESLPDKFSSYSKAIAVIKTTEFIYTDEYQPESSSWILSANYYSCNENNGYLVFKTQKGKEYVHEKVSFEHWNGLRNASSAGAYYNSHIKGRYRLVPE